MGYVDKYKEGVFSNSMLDAWETCPYKAWVLYVKRAELLDTYDKVLDSLSLGVGVHELLEAHCSKPIPCTVESSRYMLTELAPYEKFLSAWSEALAETHVEGAKWGKVYTAPTWTGYWKKNFSHLDKQKAEINQDLKKNNWLCDIEPLDFVFRAQTCFENYNKLFNKINLSAEPLIEETFSFDFLGRTVVGTMDRVDYTPSGELVISDFKTGSKQYTESIVQNLNQLNLYKLKLDPDNNLRTTFRIISLERGEIVEASYCPEAGRKYKERLRRQLIFAEKMQELPPEDLPVMAGKSLAMGCPCVLSRISGPYKCNLI